MVSPETQTQEEVRERQPSGERRKQRSPATGMVVGASTEIIAGAAAIVIAVLGLVGVVPLFMAAIATIVIGAAIMLEGAAVSRRLSALQDELDGASTFARAGGGLSAELLGGGAGVVLGVLALVNILPLILLPVAALVYGGTLLLAGVTRPAVVELTERDLPQRRAEDRARRASQAALTSSSGLLVLAGAATAVIGILVLAEIAPPVSMVLIAMLVVGAAILLSGSALAARVGRGMRQA